MITYSVIIGVFISIVWAPLFPAELIKQEMISDKWVDIPDEVRNIYSMWRPTDLMDLKRRWRNQKFIKTGRLFLMEKLRNSMVCYVFF
jgi:predicted alternative tryptophan synthase beta-subunit